MDSQVAESATPETFRYDEDSETPENSFTAANLYENMLCKWCSRQAPKESFFGYDDQLSTRPSSDCNLELESTLAATKIPYNGLMYLPLTADTIYRLSSDWNHNETIAKNELFENIIITNEINNIHADHVIEVLERIGMHGKQLLVMSPIKTSELGDVFNRETNNISPGNDWDTVFRYLPHLNYVVFVRSIDEIAEFDYSTLRALHAAVARHQAAMQLNNFEYKDQTRLIENKK
jgi:hypothetical protein